MPIVSEFFGIAICMFCSEHGVPHFHEVYQGKWASYHLDGRPLAGKLGSRTANRLIAEWARAHEDELAENWSRLRLGTRPARIKPLK